MEGKSHFSFGFAKGIYQLGWKGKFFGTTNGATGFSFFSFFVFGIVFLFYINRDGITV